jgi:polysaccharide pyruvyl transferase WcaK-like protein
LVRRRDPNHLRSTDISEVSASDSKPKISFLATAKAGIKKWPALSMVLKLLKRPLDAAQNLWAEIRFWNKSYKLLRPLDMLIMSGGGALDEFWGGPWRHPYTVFKWAVLSSLSRVPLFVMSVGAETMDSPLSRFFICRCLSRATYRSFRDQESRDLFKNLRVPGENHVFPDLAFSLQPNLRPARVSKREGRRVVGISPIAYLDPRSWPRKDSGRYLAYVGTLTSFSAWLLERGYAISFFASDIYMDRLVIHDIIAKLRNRGGTFPEAQIFESPVTTLPALLTQLANADFIVASRLHGVILSHVMGTPVIAISYDPKVDRLMRSLELSEYCLDIDAFDLNLLSTRFCALEVNREAVQKHVAEKAAEFRDLLKAQYDDVFLSRAPSASRRKS